MPLFFYSLIFFSDAKLIYLASPSPVYALRSRPLPQGRGLRIFNILPAIIKSRKILCS